MIVILIGLNLEEDSDWDEQCVDQSHDGSSDDINGNE